MIRHPVPTPRFEIPEEDIRKCAYYLWLEAGRPAGRDLEFWHAARERLGHSPHLHRPHLERPAPGRRPGQKVRKSGQEARSGAARIPLG